jgi:isoquinoline 1-oxidoreductase beta subunit
MSARVDSGRRRFLQRSASIAGALVLPLQLSARTPPPSQPFEPNAFVSVLPDDRVVLTVQRSEMGQGIRTALAMLLCDELDADWSRVTVEQAPGHERYGDQDTVGDFSLVVSWLPLRKAAASVREMFIEAASRRLGVDRGRLNTRDGRVIVAGTMPERSLRYGELVAEARALPVPASPRLKAPSEFRLIGRPTPGIDLKAITMGQRVYGLDVQRPGMLFAVVERAPSPGWRVQSFDEAAVKQSSGVHAVFELPGRFAGEGATYPGVAIVASDSWSCLKARRLLAIRWDRSEVAADASLDSETLRRRMEAAAGAGGTVFRSAGDVDEARRRAAHTLARRYHTPLQAHAPLEPPNCTADVRADACELWAPTQSPGTARERVAAELGLPRAKVTLHVTAIGGGFGRKSMHDFVLEAVRISRRVGRPVKLFWTREDDLRHGYFRSASLQSLEAGWDAEGETLFWRHHTVHASGQPTSEDVRVDQLGFGEAFGGASRVPWRIAHQRFEGSHVEMPVKRSWMRGVQDTFHAFAANCFIDELAQHAGRDPVDWRLALLGEPRRMQFVATRLDIELWMDTGRYAAVIRKAAQMSCWSERGAARRALGLASNVHGATPVAMVAEVVRHESGFRLERIWCAVDCGLVLNPDSARAQVEGAVIYGLSGALHSEITLAGGAVVQSNFHDYQVARLADAPKVEVAFIEGSGRPVGLGEPCVPLVAPAIANALAAAGAPRQYAWPLRMNAA